MNRLLLLTMLLTLMATASSAQAQTTIIEPSGAHHPYQEWVDASEVPTPDVTVRLIEAGNEHETVAFCGKEAQGCEGCPVPVLGSACPNERMVLLVVGSGQDRWDLFHELGHTMDEEGILQEWQRERFRGFIREPLWPWRGGETYGEEVLGISHAPNEWFAETFALCATLGRIFPRADYNVNPGVMGGRVARRACWMLGRRTF